jgi:hypothetical protein
LFNTNADTNLYYADALRIQTTGYGATVYGTTQTQNLNVSGVTTFSNSVNIDDFDQLRFGTNRGEGLNINYNGVNGFIGCASSSSNLYIQTPPGNATGIVEIRRGTFHQKMATFTDGGSVDLYYDNALKFRTTNTGAVVTGILTATGNMTVASNLSLEGDGTDSFIKETSATGELTISTNQLKIENPSFETLARFNENSDVQLYYDNNLKLSTTNTGVNISGITTSTSFTTNSTTGDGSDRGFTTKYYITADGSTSYRFAGPGVANTTANPTLYLHRGFTYIFENSTGSAHPFELRVSDGGAAWAPGNFLSGSINGTQVLTVPFDAQASIVYQCTLHSGMVGTINFVS